ncbi:unnamed protein product [Linum tenue]|uniref:Mannosyltransferase n=1 Tax=Linum tenue TaxID=586396 RepID=A0AAV0QU07_9ROSI|nr:unnamed protein product [Linum tenue]
MTFFSIATTWITMITWSSLELFLVPSSVAFLFEGFPLRTVAGAIRYRSLIMLFPHSFRSISDFNFSISLSICHALAAVSKTICTHSSSFSLLLLVRLALGSVTLGTFRFFRIQVRQKFGHQVEGFLVVVTAFQFHLLFYSTRGLPNILALGGVNLAYGYWLKQKYYVSLNCLIFVAIVFRCDMLLLIGPLGLQLLLIFFLKSSDQICFSFWLGLNTASALRYYRLVLPCPLTPLCGKDYCGQNLKYSGSTLFLTEALNGVLMEACSLDLGDRTHSFHWYFTSALPRSLLAAYPLFMLGVVLDRRVRYFVLPVVLFILLYSKLPHKELRFIISSVPMFNLSAAVAASRIYNNRKKTLWKLYNFILLGLLLISVGCTAVSFMASYENYPSGHALKELHQNVGDVSDNRPNIGSYRYLFSHEWNITLLYSKEESIPLKEYKQRNFTYLVSEHSSVDGYECLFSVNGFSRILLQHGFPPVALVKKPKVYVHGDGKVMDIKWRGCS